MNERHCRALTFLCVAGAYAGVATPLFAAWEIAQLPLYTIWVSVAPRRISLRLCIAPLVTP